MIILDTSVVSELLRAAPTPGVEAWLSVQDGGAVYLTAVSEAEIRYGLAVMPAGRRKATLVDAVEGMLRDDFRDRILPFDSKAAEHYARIAADRKAAGRPISRFDCQIAAITRFHGAVLATRNVGDFEGCGITVLNPWRRERDL